MITPRELDELVRIDGGATRVLSVQLDLSLQRQADRAYVVAFTSLARELDRGLDAAARSALEGEVERVRQFLAQEQPRGLGVAIYSCAPLNLWRVYPLPEPVPDRVTFRPRPRIRPVLDLIDQGERYVAALVDSDHARLLVIRQAEVEDFWAADELIQGRHKQGGWSQANFQRSHDDSVDAHLRAVCRELAAIDEREPFTRLVLAGPEEPLSRQVQLLPPDLRRRVAGTFPGQMFQSDAEVVRASLAAAREAERRDEQQLTAQVLDSAASGGLAAEGPDAVLFALAHGAVHQLMVADGIELAGGVCPSCGRLATAADDRCPSCGAVLSPVDDVVEEAILRTLAASGDVEIVHAPATEELLARAGGIAARLRFVATPVGAAL
jgi:peptide subunit release factor 1 (eRF1)